MALEPDYNHISEPKATRVVLIGRTGTGKSASGNSIIGHHGFDSRASGQSVTRRCTHQTSNRFGRTLLVVDTPGLFDTAMSMEEIGKEVIKCVALTAPGPHAFILVTSIGRFTDEEKKTVDYFRKIFGERMLNHLLVLFTRGDELDYDNIDVHDYVRDVPPALENLLQLCDYRYCCINNRGKKTDIDCEVRELLRLVDITTMGDDQHFYSNDAFEIATQEIEKRKKTLERKLSIEEKQYESDMKNKMENDDRKLFESHTRIEKRLEAGIQHEIEAESQSVSEEHRVHMEQKVNSLLEQLDQERARCEHERRRLKEENKRHRSLLKQKYRERRNHTLATVRRETENEEPESKNIFVSLWTKLFRTVLDRF